MTYLQTRLKLNKTLYTLWSLIHLIRVKQWVKNLFIFIPAFFAGNLFVPSNSIFLIPGFFSFSFIAGAIYIFNDYRDIELDRNHPEKHNRPLASGSINIPTAMIAMFIFVTIGFVIAFLINIMFFVVVALYFILNLGYSLGLKNISIVDIFIVASGFLLRIIAGGIIADVPISQWLIIMVFLLSLFLALAKRRDDILIFLDSGRKMRKSIQNYNLDFTNSSLTFLSAVIMVAYIMYTVSPEVIERLHNDYVYFTCLFVIAGIMRYLQIIFVLKDSSSPTKVLYSDTLIIFSVLGWIISFYFIIYFNN